MVVRVEANDSIGLRHLVRRLFGEEPREFLRDGDRTIRLEGIQRLLVINLTPASRIEPQLVLDDAPTQIAAHAVARRQRGPASNALRSQVVVNVVALKIRTGLVVRGGAVELVAARLHDRHQVDAAAGHFRAVAERPDGCLFNRRVVIVVRLTTRGLQAARLYSFERRVRLSGLTEHAEGRHLIQRATTHIAQGAHAGRLRQQRHDAVATGRQQFNRLARELRGRGRRRHVDHRGGAGYGDRLFE